MYSDKLYFKRAELIHLRLARVRQKSSDSWIQLGRQQSNSTHKGQDTISNKILHILVTKKMFPTARRYPNKPALDGWTEPAQWQCQHSTRSPDQARTAVGQIVQSRPGYFI